MKKSVTYRGAPANKNIGGKTHGGFKNSGQKKGSGEAAKARIGSRKGKEVNKETLAAKDPVDAKLAKISKAMFGSRKATGEATMRAQLNG